jgi:hypothetical protein
MGGRKSTTAIEGRVQALRVAPAGAEEASAEFGETLLAACCTGCMRATTRLEACLGPKWLAETGKDRAQDQTRPNILRERMPSSSGYSEPLPALTLFLSSCNLTYLIIPVHACELCRYCTLVCSSV